MYTSILMICFAIIGGIRTTFSYDAFENHNVKFDKNFVLDCSSLLPFDDDTDDEYDYDDDSFELEWNIYCYDENDQEIKYSLQQAMAVMPNVHEFLIDSKRTKIAIVSANTENGCVFTCTNGTANIHHFVSILNTTDDSYDSDDFYDAIDSLKNAIKYDCDETWLEVVGLCFGLSMVCGMFSACIFVRKQRSKKKLKKKQQLNLLSPTSSV